MGPVRTGGRLAIHSPIGTGPMFVLRYLFKTVFLWLIAKLFGRFLPILKRLIQLIFR